MANFIVSAEHAVKVLNEAFKLDPEAIENMIDSIVVINKELSFHPTIQTSSKPKPGKTAFVRNENNETTGIVEIPSGEHVNTLSLTGLLNGIFGVDENGQGPIARKYNEHGEFAGFCINTNLSPDAAPVRATVDPNQQPGKEGKEG